MSVPTNRLAPTARPRRLQPVRPNSASGASHCASNGPAPTQAGVCPCEVASTGNSRHHAHTAKPATIPAIAARGGVCGRHTAKASAGASVARAEKLTAPTSASAALPATMRPYIHANNMIATMPARRSSSTVPRRSPRSPRVHGVRFHERRSSPGASQWLPIIRLSVSVLTTTMPIAALMPPRNANRPRPAWPCDSGSASTYMSELTPLPSKAWPARASGSTGSAISTR